jgi:DNA polymerase delta subunit 2
MLHRTTATYDPCSSRREQLLLKQRSYQQQYANIYFQRLVNLKPHVVAQAQQRWSSIQGSRYSRR